MRKINFILVILIALVSFSVVYAEEIDPRTTFKDYFEIGPFNINVLTVVDLSLNSNDVSKDIVGVYSKNKKLFIPSKFSFNSFDAEKRPITAINKEGDNVFWKLIDGSYVDYEEFPLTSDDYGVSRITLKYQEPISSNGLNFALDQYVSLPFAVSVSAVENSVERPIIVDVRPDIQSVSFPETVSDTWLIEFQYSQPLRITELSLKETNKVVNSKPSVRFLAQPGDSYVVYLNPDRYINLETGESPNLNNNEDIFYENVSSIIKNELYVESDIDDDGISDRNDNCVNVSNSDQVDVNKNNRGDACDDFDKDQIINSKDNCSDEPNRDQIDTDNDGKGDACDGEESRITEKYPIIVWGGLAFAFIIFLGLMIIAMRSKNHDDSNNDGGNPIIPIKPIN